MQQAEPNPLTWREPHWPVRTIINSLVMLLSLLQTVTNFRQKLITFLHSSLHRRKTGIARLIRMNGRRRMTI
jgi:hypothetical protein